MGDPLTPRRRLPPEDDDPSGTANTPIRSFDLSATGCVQRASALARRAKSRLTPRWGPQPDSSISVAQKPRHSVTKSSSVAAFASDRLIPCSDWKRFRKAFRSIRPHSGSNSRDWISARIPGSSKVVISRSPRPAGLKGHRPWLRMTWSSEAPVLPNVEPQNIHAVTRLLES